MQAPSADRRGPDGAAADSLSALDPAAPAPPPYPAPRPRRRRQQRPGRPARTDCRARPASSLPPPPPPPPPGGEGRPEPRQWQRRTSRPPPAAGPLLREGAGAPVLFVGGLCVCLGFGCRVLFGFLCVCVCVCFCLPARSRRVLLGTNAVTERSGAGTVRERPRMAAAPGPDGSGAERPPACGGGSRKVFPCLKPEDAIGFALPGEAISGMRSLPTQPIF